MPSPLRLRLAGLRLLLLFALGCFLILQAGLLLRAVREQDQGSAGAQPSPSDFPYLGITLDPGGLAPDALEQELARLADAGFGWVRVRLAWDAIEPAPDQWQWAAADALVAAIGRAGLEPVLVLDGSPAWARAPQDQAGEDAPLAPPASIHSFARFAAAVAMRFGPQVRVYQLWDEPNISPHWGARHVEAAGYARLLKAASSAVRAADPDATILLAALAPTADRGHTAQDEVYFLQRLYAAGAAPYFDAVALQPFGFGTAPHDSRQQITTLNFRRAVLIRRAMVAAGDGGTPIWLVRYGWNRALNSPWGTVSARNQTEFAIAALAQAHSQWPWVAAQGWALHAPALAPGDPMQGFSLTDDLAAAFQDWSQHTAMQPRPTGLHTAQPWPLLGRWLVLAALAMIWGWRTAVTLGALPWQALQRRYLALPLSLRLAIWAGLGIVYWYATWPPLIALCWVIAALLIAAQPVWGLGVALAALPFHALHKEVQWVDAVWTIPPAYAALLCSLPALWPARRVGAVFGATCGAHMGILCGWKTAPTRWLGVSWIVVALLGAWHVWHWPGYLRGVVELALIPLLIFGLIRAWPAGRPRLPSLAAALWLGGLLAALVGLASWLRGGGTTADGLLRLVGPTSSPNHTALYLERSLFLGIGLALAATGGSRRLWLAANAAIALALLLTGSRGALLLGLPAGAISLLALRPSVLNPLRRIPRPYWTAAVATALLCAAGLVWMAAPRLLNSATLVERWEVWGVSLALWRDHLWVGTGPGGFYWRYPAYLPLDSTLDPNLRHPHMLWLEVAAQGGIAALVWLVVALACGAQWLMTRRDRLSWPQMGLVAGLVAGLAHAQVDAFQALPDLAAWNWAALALLLAWPDGPEDPAAS